MARLPCHVEGQQTLFKRAPAIPHNKFIVRLRRNAPAGLDRSTNSTNTGFLGQTNVGHLVTDEGVAKTYLAYWTG